MNEIAQSDPFAGALATLRSDWPAKFTLEVDAGAFCDVESLAEAHRRAGLMEAMKRECSEIGYTLYLYQNMARSVWEYTFIRRADAVRPALADVDLEVEVLHLGEDSV